MAGRVDVFQQIHEGGVIAVIRAKSSDQLIDVCKALVEGGVRVMEITMTTPNALAAIAQARKVLGDNALIGVGSVLDPETARAAILADAQFVFSPTLNLDVITMAHRYDRLVVPGAFTPTEILTAWQAGADLVKVFPANHFGPRYFQDLLAPMPQLKLTPTGGVDLNTAADWLKAGAVALGVGSSLVRKDLIEGGKWQELSALAAEYAAIVRQHRDAR